MLPGVGCTLLLGAYAQASLVWLLPIAASDLILVLHERSALSSLAEQAAGFGLGVGFMQGIALLEETLLPG